LQQGLRAVGVHGDTGDITGAEQQNTVLVEQLHDFSFECIYFRSDDFLAQIIAETINIVTVTTSKPQRPSSGILEEAYTCQSQNDATGQPARMLA